MRTTHPTTLGIFGRYIAAIRAVSREIRAERQVAQLPDYLRKDIGWPDADAIRRRETRLRREHA